MQFQPDSVICEFEFKGELVRPGMLLRMKVVKTPVLYRCLLHDTARDLTFALCKHQGQWKVFNVRHIKGIVYLKRSYKKTCRN